MAEIGKRYGIATLFGLRFHGFVAWWLWRTFYLTNLPSFKKKIKVMSDWTSDLFFSPDVAMIKRFVNSNLMNKKLDSSDSIGDSEELNQHLN